MQVIEKLQKIWKDSDYPFLTYKDEELKFSEITSEESLDLSSINAGDVVALIGDFNPHSILTLLNLIELGAIIVPLTKETRNEHEYFFESASVDLVIEDRQISHLNKEDKNYLIKDLKKAGHSGLILFSTGTTGRPKAILHDLTLFLQRYETPRHTFRTMNFLLFDHIGGLNTLFHTLFNKGVVIAPESRSIDSILAACNKYKVEVLPTTPTFLRLLLMSGLVPREVPSCLKIITYGTEKMDQPTLNELCKLLPDVDFRQTFGMSELGIVRVKSESRDSLYMKIGGEGVETKIINNVLQIKSKTRMLGYLNAPSPFDKDGWYDTKDVVEEKDGLFKVVGRTDDVINVGGLKFMASEVERVALEYDNVILVKAYGKNNPITGEHVELKVQSKEDNLDKNLLLKFLQNKLQAHMVPKRIILEEITIGHRFKKI